MKNKVEIDSNIEDKKRIYRIDNSEAIKLNDIKGEIIDVKEYIIKYINVEPVYDENGVNTVPYSSKKITLLVDNDDKIYVTASRFFASQLEEYLEYFGKESIKEDGFKIKVIERSLSNSKNKALGFELEG